MPLSLSHLASDLGADATAISFDLPGGLYDRLHDFMESHSVLPETRRGRMGIIAALLVASRIVQQQLGSLGPLANFTHELGQDGIREEAKRILEVVMKERSSAPRGPEALWNMDDEGRRRLLALYDQLGDEGRARMHAHLTRRTAAQLALLARLSPAETELLLELLSPHRAAGPSVPSRIVDGIAGFLFPWVRRS